jgi:hypothetical protein
MWLKQSASEREKSEVEVRWKGRKGKTEAVRRRGKLKNEKSKSENPKAKLSLTKPVIF